MEHRSFDRHLNRACGLRYLRAHVLHSHGAHEGDRNPNRAQLGVGVLLGTPFAGVFVFEVGWDSGQISTHMLFLVTLIMGASVMILIGLLACTAPTLRALRIMPTEALREGG